MLSVNVIGVWERKNINSWHSPATFFAAAADDDDDTVAETDVGAAL